MYQNNVLIIHNQPHNCMHVHFFDISPLNGGFKPFFFLFLSLFSLFLFFFYFLFFIFSFFFFVFLFFYFFFVFYFSYFFFVFFLTFFRSSSLLIYPLPSLHHFSSPFSNSSSISLLSPPSFHHHPHGQFQND